MTFEEFFTKKRIDLALLRRAKPALYEEFRDHYAQMSEKSFDHTKKYWFNRLRKDFLLEVAEPPKPAAPAAAAAKQTDGSVANVPDTKPAGSSTAPPGLSSVSPSGFKPRFKPSAPVPSSEQPAAAASKPVGFKPRFKAGTTTPVKKMEGEDEPAAEKPGAAHETPAAASKPLGFKPRFKAGKTTNKKDDTDTT